LKKSWLFAVVFIVTAHTASAGVYQNGSFKVESIRLAASGTYVRFEPAPTACEGGDHYRMHALISNENPNADKVVSTLLAAYAADLKFQYLWFSNDGVQCSTTHILTLEMIELKHK